MQARGCQCISRGQPTPNSGCAACGDHTGNNNDAPPSSCLPRGRGSSPSATDSYGGRTMHLHLTPSGHDVARPPYRTSHNLLAGWPVQQAWHHHRQRRLALTTAGPVLPPHFMQSIQGIC